VEDVTLFTTTVVNVWTNERATLSNGSLASSRIINAARSPQAYLYVYLKFSVDGKLTLMPLQ
jgi:small-conductance mechanosensitive channel